MQLRSIIFINLLFSMLFSGCSWCNIKGDIVTMSPLPKVNNQFQPITVWKHLVGNGTGKYYSTLHPACQDDRVFVADRYGLVKALEINTGKEIWSVNLSIYNSFLSHKQSALLSGGLTVADNWVYIGSELAKVYALCVTDGSIGWQTTVGGEVLSRLVVSNDIVLVYTSNGMLQALNKFDGIIKWTVNFDVPILTLRGISSFTTALGMAIVGGYSGRVNAICINQGQLIWQQHISYPKGSTELARLNDVQTPLVVDGIIYAISYNGNLAALDLYSGQIIWSQEVGSVTELLVDSGRIYLIDQEGRVIALDIQQGTSLWCQSNLLHRNLTSPVLYKGYIVIGDSEGYLHWMDIDDGHFVVQQKVNSAGLLSKPIVSNENLIVQVKNGEVCAFFVKEVY